MNNILKLLRFYDLAKQYLELNPMYKGVSIDLPDDVVINVTWHIEGNKRFRSRQFPLKDLPGVTEKLRQKVKYQKAKNEIPKG